MPGQLTLGGLASGIAGGAILVGPSSVAGSKSKPELQNIELEAGVELKVKLPAEAVQWAVLFEFQSSPPVVTIKTNVAGDGVLSVPAVGFASGGVTSTMTEIAFKAATAPKIFQLFVY